MDQPVGTLSLGFVEGLYADYFAIPIRCRRVAAVFRRNGRLVRLAEARAGPPLSGDEHVQSAHPRAIGCRRRRLPQVSGADSATGRTTGIVVGDAQKSDQGRHLDVAFSQDRVDQLIRSYRVRGHKVAQDRSIGTSASAAARAGAGLLRLHRRRISTCRFRRRRSRGPRR